MLLTDKQKNEHQTRRCTLTDTNTHAQRHINKRTDKQTHVSNNLDKILGAKHNEVLNWYRMNWRLLKLPPLYAEIYEIPKDEEQQQQHQAAMAANANGNGMASGHPNGTHNGHASNIPNGNGMMV